jgi:hypothetical protein
LAGTPEPTDEPHSAANPPAPGHTVYTSVVEGDQDLVGLVAYSLYKRDKLAFMAMQLEQLDRSATQEEVIAFARGACLPGPVAAYRQSATYLMQQMYDDLLAVQVAEVEEKYKEKLTEELKKAHPFWEAVLQHFLASVFLVALGGLIALIYAGQHAGWRQMVSNIFDLPAAESPQAPASSSKH